jgi:hypothetical protein
LIVILFFCFIFFIWDIFFSISSFNIKLVNNWNS